MQRLPERLCPYCGHSPTRQGILVEFCPECGAASTIGTFALRRALMNLRDTIRQEGAPYIMAFIGALNRGLGWFGRIIGGE